MALYYLRRGNPGRALEWLPDAAVRLYPSLRLLRARVARSEQGRGEALAWLEQDPPAPERHPDYHTMLAALYQQTGQPAEAASIWAGLLETNDSQARWWAGLGIALESQGRSESARSAFAQAARLPGLPEQLRLYVEQRLSGKQG
jgi:MSHA biogenesis protein MshN